MTGGIFGHDEARADRPAVAKVAEAEAKAAEACKALQDAIGLSDDIGLEELAEALKALVEARKAIRVAARAV